MLVAYYALDELGILVSFSSSLPTMSINNIWMRTDEVEGEHVQNDEEDEKKKKKEFW